MFQNAEKMLKFFRHFPVSTWAIPFHVKLWPEDDGVTTLAYTSEQLSITLCNIKGNEVDVTLLENQ
jgi:hypothetical protein